MKHFKTTALLFSSVAVLLGAGCGGSEGSATIGGIVYGLSGGTSVGLVDNGTDPISVGANGSFTFDVKIPAGSSYNVTVPADDNPVGEICSITGGAGTVDSNADPITTVVVQCDSTSTS